MISTKHPQLLSVYCVQEIVLSDLHLLSHLIFTVVLADNITLSLIVVEQGQKPRFA